MRMKCKKCGKEFDFPYLRKDPSKPTYLIPVCPYCLEELIEVEGGELDSESFSG